MNPGVNGNTSSSAESSSDAELMAGMQAANEEACAVLFRRYGRLVKRIALDILRDRGEAEDVTQEVFLEVYCKSHLYDPSRGTVRVWFLQYAYHRTLRRKAALSRRAAYRGEPLNESDGTIHKRHTRLTTEECRWIICAGLSRLPERQRKTLELVCFEDFSLRDVAAHLGVSVGCARHYYYRGLARLRAWATAGANDRQPAASLPQDPVQPLQPIELMAGKPKGRSRTAAVPAVRVERGAQHVRGPRHRVPASR